MMIMIMMIKCKTLISIINISKILSNFKYIQYINCLSYIYVVCNTFTGYAKCNNFWSSSFIVCYKQIIFECDIKKRNNKII